MTVCRRHMLLNCVKARHRQSGAWTMSTVVPSSSLEVWMIRSIIRGILVRAEPVPEALILRRGGARCEATQESGPVLAQSA